jgi:TP901 family phage tail tape measure protein
MADVESNIHVNIDTSDALASLKLLQRQISAFHTQMSKSGTAASAVAANQAQNLMNSINATGKFNASMRTVTSSTESFTNALERNKLTSREYFRYTGAATKTFGRLFASEFETLNKVARERVKDIQTQYVKMGRGANGALQAIAVRPLTLDMKNLGTQTAIAAQRQQLLNQLLRQGSTNLLNFGKNTQWAGRQLMVGFTVPLVMLGSVASKTFMKLEEQAIRFKRVYGEMFTTQAETDAMVKQVQKLATEYTKYGVAIEDTMKMAADAAAMGKQGADLLAQIAQATRLAVLGGVDQAQALQTTISVTNAFGVAADQLAGKIDFLNAVENQTVVSIEDLTTAIPKAGPVVKQLGGSVEDLAFFLTAMKEGGINASEGANALKSGLASLINPSAKASKMLAGLGVNIKGIVEANKGDIKATVVGFAQALDTLDPLNRARAIEQLFGKFQFSRLSTLFQNVTAQGTQAQRVLQLTQATTEELAILSQRELDKIQNTTTYKFKKSMQDLKLAIAPVGEQFLKALTPIVEFVGKVLDKFNNLGDGTKKFLTILTVALAGVGPVLLMGFGLVANAVANIIKMFVGLKSVFNRTGQSSQILGEQTNYLTKEQLEASAVAASLDQVHQRLRQTFTSETAAVNMLANAYRRAIASQIGFVGPSAGKSMPTPKKYSKGTTSVPGTGNKDTVNADLTPGEAVIPQQSAQDPANRPAIAHMVAGGRIQGLAFAPEAVKTKDNNATKMSETHVGGKSEPRLISDIIKAHPEMTDNQRLKLITMEQVLLSQGLPAVTTTKHGLMFDFPLEINKKMYGEGIPKQDFINEWIKDGAAKWHPSGMTPVQAQALDDAFLTAVKDSKATMINDDLLKNLYEEKIPKIISPNDPGYIKSKGLYVTDFRFNMGQGLGTTPESSAAILEKAKTTINPATGKPYIADYEIKTRLSQSQGKIVTSSGSVTLNPGMYNGFEIKEPTTVNMNRLGTGTTPTFSKKKDSQGIKKSTKTKTAVPLEAPKLIDLQKALDHKEKLQAVAADAAGTSNGIKKPTNFGVQQSQSSGRSNFMSTIGGVYIKPDGTKVFVKPMLSELDAIAEKRATEIARTVHGLSAPKQTIRTMIDPTDTTETDINKKRKVIVLESPFDPKFDPNTMPKTFTQRDYFRQLVASSLRADKDLKKGNLGGNVLADVGAAGVFDTASGKRTYSKGLPSMEEIAMHNFKGVTGANANASPFWFGNATADIPQNIKSAKEYKDLVVAEIERTLPKLRKKIDSFKFADNDPAKKVYEDMYKRLEAGKAADWEKVYNFHRSILVKPDEVLQDKKGNLKPIPTKPNNGKLKSNSGSISDTRLAPASVASSVRQGPKARIVGKANAPGSKNATVNAVLAGVKGSVAKAKAAGATIGKTISQSAAASSRTTLYGTGPIDSDAKSLRRQMEKRQRAEAKTQAKMAASKTKLYGMGPMDADAKSMRRQMERRSKLANSVAYQKRIISEKAAAQFTKAPSVSATPIGPSMANGKFETTKLQRTKNNLSNSRAAGKGGMGLAGGVGLAAGAAMIGSMAPGKVGEISQKLMMPLMGLSMIIPMLKSPASALAVGLVATVGSFVALRMAFDKAANNVLQEGEKFKGSTSAIQSIAKFGGKATASEQMDLRRKNSFSMLGPATGKTTYGESFVQTAEGKALTAKISEQSAKGKGNVAVKDLSGQLSAAIMSGAMDMSQAKSLAMNAGRQAGNMSIGIKVIAQLESLLGPNGENLINDPLNVRINMINANAKNMQNSANNVKNAGNLQKLAGQKVTQGLGIGASALGGAAAGAGIGTALGPAGTLAGAIIGAGIGTAVGAIGGYFASQKYAKEAAVLGATYAVDAKIAMEQNKQILDSFDMYYQKKIEELTLQGKINEANQMQNDYIRDRNTLTAAQSALQANIVSQYNSAGGLQESMMSGMKKATTAKYKNDPNQLAYIDTVNQQSKNLRKDGLINSGQEFLIQAKMASGDIPPAVFRTLLQMATDNKDIAPKMMNIITKFTGATSESIGVAAQNILDAKGDVNKTIQTNFITKVEAFEKDSDALDFTKNMIKLNNLNTVIPSDFMVSFYIDPKNKAAYDELNRILDAIETQKPKTIDAVYSIMPQLKGSAAFNEAYFKSLTDDQKLVYTTTIASIINIPDPQIEASADYIAWTKESGPHGGADVTGSIANKIAKYKEAQGWKAVTDNTQVGVAAPAKTTSTGGNTVQASPLDDLIKKLRDVRMNQIMVTEGWGASRKALDKLFGGSKTINVFSGIENDLRGLGGSQDLIELIIGMDPKVYEQKKNSLFKFDNKGNIIALKRDATNIQEALNSITMGDWNSSMEADLKAIDNQSSAFNKLANLGVPVADAYQLISDKTIASAIANGVNDKTLKTLIERYKTLTAAQQKSAAISGVKTDIAQFKKDTMQEARLRSKYGAENAFAISSDENLKAMENQVALAQAKVDRLMRIDAPAIIIGAAQGELNALISDFNERLNQLKSTVEFMQGLFDKGFGNAMQAFDVKETALNIQFKLDTKSKDTIIKDAQNAIASIQYKIDDKQAALKGIEDQEQKINDKYDERIQALNEVEKANATISNQQKGQLTLAEALTSGDIAAAARAAQDIRAQEAADAVTKQKDAVEQSRKYELAGVTAIDKTDGKVKTRKQLEEEIKTLETEIFKIEEDKLEPAQEFIRLRQIQLDKDIEGLTVLGLTKDAWAAIKNEVDLALIKSAAFVESMQLALDVQKRLIDAYNTQKPSAQVTPAVASPNKKVADPATTPEVPAVVKKAADAAAADAAAATTAAATSAADAVTGATIVVGNKTTTNTAGTIEPTGSNRPTDQSSVVQMHFDDLQKIADDAAKNFMLFNQAMNVLDVTKNAGSTPGQHLDSLYKQQNAAAIQNAMKPTAGMLAQEKAVRDAANATAAAAAAKKAKDEATLKKFGGNAAAANAFGNWSTGGLIPKYFNFGGFAKGTDTVPAMLTPGEFIMSKYAVDSHGVDTMRAINNGQTTGGAVYNNTYTLTVNAKTNANPNEIAQAVMSTIKRVDDRRVRGVSING